MEKEQVVTILEFFRDADKLIADNKWEIQDLERQHYNSARAIHISGMPCGKGIPSNPVEQMAMQSIHYGVAKEIGYLELQNERIQQVKLEIRREIDGLGYQQRTIITKFYIEQIYWSKISRQMHFSVSQCKRIRNVALRNLSNKFACNPVINSYSFPKNER